MELRDALIPAYVADTRVDLDTQNVISMDGMVRSIPTRREITLTVKLMPRNDDELNWLVQSLKENGNRVSLVPDGSPIMHPTEFMAQAMTAPTKTDQPKEAGNLIW